MDSDRRPPVAAILALATLPFLFEAFIPWMHGMDLATFKAWGEAWSQSPADVYRNSSCNYPPLGAALTAGILSLMGSYWPSIGFWELMGRYRFFLAAFESASALLFLDLLRRAKVKHSWKWALCLVVLPSTWAGTSVWGQIDGITQFFLLAWVYLWLRKIEGVSVLFGAFAFSCALLTKQLALFAVPAFFAGLGLRAKSIGFRRALRGGSWVTAVMLGALLLPELLFHPPAGQRWVAEFILGGKGNDHYRKIAMNGFNFWTLFTNDPRGPSSEIWFATLSSFTMGIVLCFGSLLTAAVALFRFQPKDWAGAWLLFFSFVELSVNVWMTGTHERYLVHFHAFAIAGALILKRQKLAAIFAAAGFVYGAYVLFILYGSRQTTEFYPLWPARLMAIFHLGLWSLLLVQLFRVQRIGPRAVPGSANATQ